MRFLEELSMNALPSMQTILYDGWILRFADGYTNRANSVNPIYTSTENVHEKIDKCEAVFRNRNLKPTYKITPFVFPENLDEILENRGYGTINHASLQMLNLRNLCEPSIHTSVTNCKLDDEWFENYCNFNYISTGNKKTYKKMLENLVPLKFFTSLYMENEVVACGMAVLENDFIGLFDITVNEKHRNCGYGLQLILNILKVGICHGAENAYLQVMLDNLPAINLYRKLGFKEEYRYHYRVLCD